MEEKEIQPTIQMKNSSIVIVKTQLVLYLGYFSFYYSLQGLFVNRNALNVKTREKVERRVKGLPFWKAFYSSRVFFLVSIYSILKYYYIKMIHYVKKYLYVLPVLFLVRSSTFNC